MGQRQMRFTMPDEVACGSVDESVLILLKHCQEMKRQETRLRLISLLLLLGCAGLFIFTQLQRNSGSSGQQSSVGQSPVESRTEYLTADPQRNTERLRIDLTSPGDPDRNSSNTIEWSVVLCSDDSNYDEKERAIVIPEEGTYLVYIRMAFRCYNREHGSEKLHIKLNVQNKVYDNPECSRNNVRLLTNAVDSVQCGPGLFRTLSMIQLYSLMKGDHLSVSLEEGYGLVTQSSFGAIFT
ncbi:uncharacterized protein LOC117831433 [Xyrichtys novacula]|uniref:Uncharacterized protein LOC117831433 n=1 Tax=Xyrichtys novacula TaxID=13765 RepID=A0AAV1GCQ6_XYRNO|nr:uncharacterized protein LOC117831433 [Xyrichtys novacula]